MSEKVETMDPFRRLEQLLAQDQFELLLEEETAEQIKNDVSIDKNRDKNGNKNENKSGNKKGNKTGDKNEIRLVYLMNDAVESFLVFEHAVLTGTYQADYEGELEASLE